MDPSLFKNPGLEGGTFCWEAGPVGVLLLHGFTATTAEVRLLAAGLFEAGYTVMGPLLPGHGVTPAELNKYRWQDWAEGVEMAYRALAHTCRAVWVGGESAGALLALHLASRRPEIAGVLAYSPALDVPALRYARLLSPFLPVARKRMVDDGLPWQGYTAYPLRAAIQLLKLQAEVRRILPQVKQPLLVFQGGKDHTIGPDSGQVVYTQAGSTRKELIRMEASGHCLILDREHLAVIQKTLQFISASTPDGSNPETP